MFKLSITDLSFLLKMFKFYYLKMINSQKKVIQYQYKKYNSDNFKMIFAETL